MSALSALILLAGATAHCPPGTPAPLAGGATIVRPVGTVEPLPFERLGPTTGLNKPKIVRQAHAAGETQDPAEGPTDICAAAPVQIV